MKKASTLPQYSNMKPFGQPTGVVDVQLDKLTNRLATPTCPDDYVAAFVAGTEPRETCDQQSGVAGLFSRFFGGGTKPLPPPQSAVGPPAGTPVNRQANGQVVNGQDASEANSQETKKKKGLFGKIAGIFKDDKSSTPPPKPPDSPQPAAH